MGVGAQFFDSKGNLQLDMEETPLTVYGKIDIPPYHFTDSNAHSITQSIYNGKYQKQYTFYQEIETPLAKYYGLTSKRTIFFSKESYDENKFNETPNVRFVITSNSSYFDLEYKIYISDSRGYDYIPPLDTYSPARWMFYCGVV